MADEAEALSPEEIAAKRQQVASLSDDLVEKTLAVCASVFPDSEAEIVSGALAAIVRLYMRGAIAAGQEPTVRETLRALRPALDRTTEATLRNLKQARQLN